MTLLEALALGVVQGVTEFLPISSSGHLALAQALLGRRTPTLLLFNVVVHLGTLFAIALVLRERILGLAIAMLSFLRGDGGVRGLQVDRRWIALVLVASVPTGLAGLGIRDFVAVMDHQVRWVGAAFLVTMALLISAERFGRRERGPEALGVADALWVGCAQSVGLLPGVSRSGATVAAALWRDVRPEVAVEFSILVSIPAILGANVLELARSESDLTLALAPLCAGFAAAFVTGIFALRALQWVVSRRRLLPFAAYCGLLGLGAIFLG